MNIKALFKLNCSVLIIILSFLLLTNSALAETKTFVKEYTYQASEADSKISSSIIALEQVKRLLLEELGTYLESQTEIKNAQLTKDKITALTAGIVKTEILNDNWDGKTYWLKAKIEVDPDSVVDSINRLRADLKVAKELEEAKKKTDRVLKEMDGLRKELNTIKTTRANKNKKMESYKIAVNKLSAQDWYLKGLSTKSLVTGGDNEDAIFSFQKVIELDPKNKDAYWWLGTLYLFSSKAKESVDMFNKAIILDSSNDNLYTLRGIAHTAAGNYKLAIADHNRAIKLTPKKGRPYINRGEAYLNMGEYLKAINDFDKGIELLSSSPTYDSLPDGNAQVALSDIQEITNEEEIIGTIDIPIFDPNSSEALAHNMDLSNGFERRGEAYRLLGNFKQAISDFTKSIEIFPDSRLNANAYYMRSLAYTGLSNFQEAINDIDKAIELKPKEPLYYNKRGTYCQFFYIFKTLATKSETELKKLDQLYDACLDDFRIAARLGHKESQEYLKSYGKKW